MLSIRAGIVNQICSKSISIKTIKDIIMFSDTYYQIEEFNQMEKMIHILDHDRPELSDKSLNKTTEMFAENKYYITNYLKEKVVKVDGHVQPTDESISTMSINEILDTDKRDSEQDIQLMIDEIIEGETEDNAIQIDYKIYNKPDIKKCDYASFIKYCKLNEIKDCKINNAYNIAKLMEMPEVPYIDTKTRKWKQNTRGLKTEDNVITKLRKKGYIIEDCPSTKVPILPSTTLSGRPDGYIKKSPVSQYNDCYLEIKCMSMSKIGKREEMQIASYYRIFGKPVLLVTDYRGVMEKRFYSTKTLDRYWKRLTPLLNRNLRKLYNLLILSDIESYRRLRNIIDSNKSIQL